MLRVTLQNFMHAPLQNPKHRLASVQSTAEGGDFDSIWVEDFVDKLSRFDRRMNQAVIDSGILSHIPQHALGHEGWNAQQNLSSHRRTRLRSLQSMLGFISCQLLRAFEK